MSCRNPSCQVDAKYCYSAPDKLIADIFESLVAAIFVGRHAGASVQDAAHHCLSRLIVATTLSRCSLFWTVPLANSSSPFLPTIRATPSQSSRVGLRAIAVEPSFLCRLISFSSSAVSIAQVLTRDDFTDWAMEEVSSPAKSFTTRSMSARLLTLPAM